MGEAVIPVVMAGPVVDDSNRWYPPIGGKALQYLSRSQQGLSMPPTRGLWITLTVCRCRWLPSPHALGEPFR